MKSLRALLGFSPRNLTLYKRAFRHKSVIQSSGDDHVSNERLEFLGDAVLELVVRDYLYSRFPTKSEGFLAEKTSKIVNREFLNNLGYEMNLIGFIDLNDNEKHFLKSPHSVYGNALEALFGAIYLDKGLKYTRIFFIDKIIKLHTDIDSVLNVETNFKSRLHEWAQKFNKNLEFKVVSEEVNNKEVFIAEIIIEKEKMGTGHSTKKKKAENLAAEKAYSILFDEKGNYKTAI